MPVDRNGDNPALASEQDIVALADSLTRSAEALHARLKKAIRSGRLDRTAAQALFQEESVLRQRANGLYAEASRCMVSSLPQTQRELLALVEAANERIHRSNALDTLLGLAGDLLVLAAAACAAQPGAIAAALHQLERDLAGS